MENVFYSVDSYLNIFILFLHKIMAHVKLTTLDGPKTCSSCDSKGPDGKMNKLKLNEN